MNLSTKKNDLFDPRFARIAVRSEEDSLSRNYTVKRSVVEWCAYECERQHVGPLAVFQMLDAWKYAMLQSRKGMGYDVNDNHPNLLTILTLGYLIDPVTNEKGVRRYNVTVGWDPKLDWPQIPRALTNLINDGLGNLPPTEWYREFEEIHPFGDGNGRTGSILWNWLRGSLSNPEYPPDVYNPDFWLKDDTFGE